MKEISRILSTISDENKSSSEVLLPLVYDELRRLAAARIAAEKPGQTLQATALVHEAYLRLVGDKCGPEWNSRGHFFGAAAEAMRRILVENARRKKANKRGGDLNRVTLNEGDAIVNESDDLLALDEALQLLEQKDALAAQVVKLRYFAGMSISETAQALGTSQRTTERNWTYAKTWLHARLNIQ